VRTALTDRLGIDEVAPAAEIVESLVRGAEEALRRART